MSYALVLAVVAAVAGALGLVQLAVAHAEARRAAHDTPARRGVVLLARLGRHVGVLAPPQDLDLRLEAAGRPFGLSPGDLMALKAGAALVAVVAGGPLTPWLPGRLPFVGLVALPLVGFLAPDGWLRWRTRQRGRAMQDELADLLDLLRVAIEAGLPLGRALGEVGGRHAGSLAREWRVAAAELSLGVSRGEALAALVGRCPAEGMPALIAAIERAERHGAPLGETLAAQALEARARRAQRIRERAAKAAPKIQLAVAALLVPSVMLLVAAALVDGVLGRG